MSTPIVFASVVVRCAACGVPFACARDAPRPFCGERCERAGPRKPAEKVKAARAKKPRERKPAVKVRAKAVPEVAVRPAQAGRMLPHPTTADVIYSDEDAEVLRAIEAYKRDRRVRFPTHSEVIEIMRRLGWRKVGSP